MNRIIIVIFLNFECCRGYFFRIMNFYKSNIVLRTVTTILAMNNIATTTIRTSEKMPQAFDPRFQFLEMIPILFKFKQLLKNENIFNRYCSITIYQTMPIKAEHMH